MGEIRKMKRLGLVGFGGFGRLAASVLSEHVAVLVHDPAHARAVLPDGREMPMGTLEEIAACDVIVLAVPVARMAHLCAALGPLLRPGSVVVDVGSVKTGPVAIMEAAFPETVEIVGTHPLFGPQSFGRAEGQKVAICPVRGRAHLWVAAFLRRIGLRAMLTTPEAHDREAAMVQGLTHLIAKVLVEMGPLPERMTTVSFDLLREAVQMVRHDPPTVLHAIEAANPYAGDIRARFFERAAEVRAQFEG